MQHTPLEAGHWSGHFDSASKEVRKTREGSEQQQAQCSSTSIQECFLLFDSHVRGVMRRDAP